MLIKSKCSECGRRFQYDGYPVGRIRTVCFEPKCFSRRQEKFYAKFIREGLKEDGEVTNEAEYYLGYIY